MKKIAEVEPIHENRDIKIRKIEDYDNIRAFEILIPITPQTTIQEVNQKAVKIASMFKKQKMTIPAYTLDDMRKNYASPEATIEYFLQDDFITTRYYYDPATQLFYLSKEHYDKINEDIEFPSKYSSSLKKNAEELGGIDFTALPAVIQGPAAPALGISHNIASSAPLTLPRNDNETNAEWLQIEKLVKADIIPSNERVRECLLSSPINGSEQKIKALYCIAAIFRLEEDNVLLTGVDLRKLLTLLESSKSIDELMAALNQITVLPK